MRLIVFLSRNWFLAFVFLVARAEAGRDCDTNWIRLMYMLSCGTRKRQTNSIPLEVLDSAPTDFKGALMHFRSHSPYDPIFMNETLLQEYFDKDETPSPRTPPAPLRLLLLGGGENEGERTADEWPEHAGKKLDDYENAGIRGFPEKWGLVLMQRETVIHQRSVNDLMEECCNVDRLRNCTPRSFHQAC